MSTSELSVNFEWVLGGFCELNLKFKFGECEFLIFVVILNNFIKFRKFEVEVRKIQVEFRKFKGEILKVRSWISKIRT